MSSAIQRLADDQGIENICVHSPLHALFRGMGPPDSLAVSFSSILELAHKKSNELELYADALNIVQQIALQFSEDLILRTDRKSFSEKVNASVNILTIDEAASICAYTMESGPYRALNKLLREENRQLLKPFVKYLWLLMHGLSKCPIPTATLVYRGVPCNVSPIYILGRVITWHSFSSCTTRVGALENDMFLGKTGERTEFHITLTTNRARSIRHLSAVPDEDEILLPPNTRLQVMDKADRGHGLCVVQLLEVECLDPILVFPDQEQKDAIPPGACSPE